MKLSIKRCCAYAQAAYVGQCLLTGVVLLSLGGCSQQTHELAISEVRETGKRAIPMEVRDADRFGWSDQMLAQFSGGAKGGGRTSTGADSTANLGSTTWHFKYALPDGWHEQPATQFRNPNVTIGEKREGQCYVTVLGGDGGGTAENVNRWRAQMGLEKIGPKVIEALPQIDLLGQPATYLELTGNFSGMMGSGEKVEDAMMLGALAEIEGHAVFVKCVGPRALIEKEISNFKDFVASLERSNLPAGHDEIAPHQHHASTTDTTASAMQNPHASMEAAHAAAGIGPMGGASKDQMQSMEEAHAAAGIGPMGGASKDQMQSMEEAHAAAGVGMMGGASGMPPMPPTEAPLDWNAPDHWVVRTDQPMRAISFRIPGKAGEADCGVFLLPGAAGGVEANINRWRRQMGMEGLSTDEIQALPKHEIAEQEGTLVEMNGTFTGMQGGPQKDSGLIGVVCELDNQTLFVKMTGPAETVKEEREMFLKFCSMLKFK